MKRQAVQHEPALAILKALDRFCVLGDEVFFRLNFLSLGGFTFLDAGLELVSFVVQLFLMLGLSDLVVRLVDVCELRGEL